jgi:hypothetical protein
MLRQARGPIPSLLLAVPMLVCLAFTLPVAAQSPASDGVPAPVEEAVPSEATVLLDGIEAPIESWLGGPMTNDVRETAEDQVIQCGVGIVLWCTEVTCSNGQSGYRETLFNNCGFYTRTVCPAFFCP